MLSHVRVLGLISEPLYKLFLKSTAAVEESDFLHVAVRHLLSLTHVHHFLFRDDGGQAVI